MRPLYCIDSPTIITMMIPSRNRVKKRSVRGRRPQDHQVPQVQKEKKAMMDRKEQKDIKDSLDWTVPKERPDTVPLEKKE
ncbi:unnamed protein product [Caenorhabditis sp. 36 PRJEB53466]|nr:unnamed protein product [Caenorhabditis sp. 36 PRJEB53466]